MSAKELRRGEVLSRVKRGELKLTEAAELLEVSYRHAKRLKKRYRAGGAKALVHGNVGRASNRADQKRRQQVLELVRAELCGRGARALRADAGVGTSGSRPRPGSAARNTAALDARRGSVEPPSQAPTASHPAQRKAHFGELIQLDGSHHHWLEERGPKACLMNFVDDATGVALCRFSDQETTWAAADLLAAWVRQHGVPKALYCDWKNVYQRQPTSREALAAIKPETQFGRMCAKLGITIMAASSPQAKGRVERHHGTHQDRLIKKMRLRGIVEYEAANRYLDEEYLAEHNERFACEPAAAADFHQALPRGTELRVPRVFCCEYERVVSNDRVVRFENRCLQLKPKRNQGVGAGARVTVQQWRDESLQVRFDRARDRARRDRHADATAADEASTTAASGGRAQAGGGPPLAASCPTQKTFCEYIRGLWKCRVGWKAWKIFSRQRSPGSRSGGWFSTLPTAPWKSLRDSHSSTAPTTTISLLRTRNTRGHFYRATEGDISIGQWVKVGLTELGPVV